MKEIEKKVKQFTDHEVKDLLTSLQSKTDLVINILRFHLLSENLLERIIMGELTRGDRVIEKGNLSFFQKLCLVNSFDMIEDAAIQSLRHLNSLRNKCSHQKGKEISFDDIEIIGRPLGKPFTKIKREHKDNLELMIVFTFTDIYTRIIGQVARIELEGDIREIMEKDLKGAT